MSSGSVNNVRGNDIDIAVGIPVGEVPGELDSVGTPSDPTVTGPEAALFSTPAPEPTASAPAPAVDTLPVHSDMVERSGLRNSPLEKKRSMSSPPRRGARGESSPPTMERGSSSQQAAKPMVNSPTRSTRTLPPDVQSTAGQSQEASSFRTMPQQLTDFGLVSVRNEIASLLNRVEQLESLVQANQLSKVEEVIRLNDERIARLEERQRTMAEAHVDFRLALDEMSRTTPAGPTTIPISTPQETSPASRAPAFPYTTHQQRPEEPNGWTRPSFMTSATGPTSAPTQPLNFADFRGTVMSSAPASSPPFAPPGFGPAPNTRPMVQPGTSQNPFVAPTMSGPFHYCGPDMRMADDTWAPARPNRNFSNPSEHGIGKSIHKEISYAISPKAPECYKFDGTIVGFEPWKTKMLNHFSTATQKYRSLIENCVNAPAQITMANLKATTVDGFNAWEIATEVESFTVRFLSGKLFEDRLALCSNEELNGLELWRNLGLKFSGKGKQAVKATGLQTFMKFGKCEDENEILAHVTEWQKYLDLYGAHLKSDDQTLRSLFLGIIPQAMEDKLTQKVAKYPTWRELRDYIKEKHEIRRQVLIAQAIHKNKGVVVSGSRRQAANALTDKPESRQPLPDAPAATSVYTAPSTEELAIMMAQEPPRRKPTRPPRGGAKERFIWKSGRCWECGAEDHTRPTCPQWLRIVGADGKPPKGHMGMKDKALKAFKEKQAKARAHMKTLGYEDHTEDEDDDEEIDETMFAIGVTRIAHEPVPTSNSFEHLESDDDDLVDAELLNDVGSRIAAVRRSNSKATIPKNATRIKSVADLDKSMSRGIIAALPHDKKSLSRLAKLCPADAEKLEPGERWVMADSGSTLHGMDVAKELPGYEHLVVPLPEKKKGRGAETASGDLVPIRGTVDLAGHVDGNLHKARFNDMKIAMPIASIRQTVKKGNDLHITEGGGVIRNRKSGKTIKLHERGGVYFFKMRFLPAALQPGAPGPTASLSPGFPRPA